MRLSAEKSVSAGIHFRAFHYGGDALLSAIMLDHTDNIILIQKKVKHCVHIIYAHHFAYLDDILAQIFFVLVLRVCNNSSAR